MTYVVDKAKNDAWLENDCKINGKSVCYDERPWAKEFKSDSAAVKYADKQPNKENLEIELDGGEVLGWVDNDWVVVFN